MSWFLTRSCATYSSQFAAAGGYILDGFPTTLPQAITAAELGAQLDLTLDAAVYLHVPEPVLVQRLLAWVRPETPRR
jgi:adenylate kinase family enzyme